MVDQVRELQRQYLNCYVTLIHEGTRVPFLVRNIYMGINGLLADGRVPGKVRWRDMLSVSWDALDLRYPELGCINSADGVIYMWRLPFRQWHRGFHYDYVDWREVLVGTYHTLGLNVPQGNNIETIKSLFKGEYPSMNEALNEVRNLDAVARAFNKHFWFGLSPYSNRIVFGYKMWAVGEVSDDNHVLLSNEFIHLREEVGQYLPVEVVRNAA